MYQLPIIAVVTQETRLDSLKERWVTASAVQFRMQQAAAHEQDRLVKRFRKSSAGGKKSLQQSAVDTDLALAAAAEALSDEDELQEEDTVYQDALKELLREVDLGFPVKQVAREFVPNFDFQRCVAVVVFGRDGLVANVAKYVGDVPVIGVNPDPQRNDGILLPFEIRESRSIVRKAVDRKLKTREVTLAEVKTNDGQRMLAFNDFFVGCKTHTSARYTVELNLQTESQSSSGLIISTGAGSTGWMSSVFNMAQRLGGLVSGKADAPPAIAPSKNTPLEADHRPRLRWEDDRLLWAVREPFISRHSSAEMFGGILERDDELVIGSQMPENGVVFSDGIEQDFIDFNSGSIAAFGVASQKAYLVVG